MNDEYDELIIYKYIKTIQVTYVHVKYMIWIMADKYDSLL